jgi:flagellar motor protein MotB
MSDNSMSKMRWVVVGSVWLVILGCAVFAYQYWFVPRQEHKAEEEAEQQHQEVIDKTSSQSRYKHEVRFHLDAFSGYAGFRAKDFVDECAKYGIKVTLIDDEANYSARFDAFANAKADMGVFTFDALIKASSKAGDIPLTAVGIVDETRGADAAMAAGKAFPNIDALNSSNLKIYCLQDSPSETLGRVILAYFNLDQVTGNPFVYMNSPDELMDAYRKASPTDEKLFITWEPFVSQIDENPDYHAVVDSSKFRGYIVDIIVARRGYLVKNEGVVENVVKAYLTTIFKNRNSMNDLVANDAKQLGDPLTPEQVDKLVQGIWWKNTQENFGHFGFTSGHGLQHAEDICRNITEVLLKTDGIMRDPTDGKYNMLYYDGIMRKLFDTSWHPGFGREDVRQEKALAALSEAEWDQLKPVGTLNVPRLVFARGTSRLSGLSTSTLDDLVDKLTTWPQYYLVVRGNTSAQGDVEANKKLAQDRADSAVEYLVSKGVDRNRIHADVSKPNGSTTVAFILGELPY